MTHAPRLRRRLPTLFGLGCLVVALAGYVVSRRRPSAGVVPLAALTIAVSFPMLGMSYQLYPEPIVALHGPSAV